MRSGTATRTPSATEPAPGLRARKKAQLHETISRAAVTLFARDGYEATTLEAVAEACDVSISTVCRYFPTKSDLVFAHAERTGDELVACLAAQPADADPTAALEAALRAICPSLTGRRAILEAQRPIVAGSPELQARQAAAQQRWERAVRAELVRRQGAPLSDDVQFGLRVLAATRLSAFRVATESWLSDTSGTGLVSFVDAACSQLAADRTPRGSRP